jgi:Asp/Glu/hydantoin racemase
MKLIFIPPYANIYAAQPTWEQELISRMKQKGQLEGVDIDIAEGYPIEHNAETRNEEFAAIVNFGMITKVKEYSGMGQYDAIIIGGTSEPGFFATQMVSKIPVVYSLHSAVHVASLIGERFSIIHLTDPGCLQIRHWVQHHGLNHKLVAVRPTGYTSTFLHKFTRTYKPEERAKIPVGKKFIEDVAARCKEAIDNDRVDSLVFECPVIQMFEDEIKPRLNDSGYGEIQLVYAFPAAVEMARTVVNMGLTQAPRAYPSDSLRAKPQFR